MAADSGGGAAEDVAEWTGYHSPRFFRDREGEKCALSEMHPVQKGKGKKRAKQGDGGGEEEVEKDGEGASDGGSRKKKKVRKTG